MKKTFFAKTDEVGRKWYIVDAAGQNLGRMATQIANVLRGKNKPEFTPGVDAGDFVVVINAEKVEMTGSKMEDKTYYWHSRFFGGMRSLSAKELLERDPAQVIEKAVKGMLPTNKLSRQLITKLKSYRGAEHPHKAQKPEPLSIQTK